MCGACFARISLKVGRDIICTRIMLVKKICRFVDVHCLTRVGLPRTVTNLEVSAELSLATWSLQKPRKGKTKPLFVGWVSFWCAWVCRGCLDGSVVTFGARGCAARLRGCAGRFVKPNEILCSHNLSYVLSSRRCVWVFHFQFVGHLFRHFVQKVLFMMYLHVITCQYTNYM